MKVSIHQKKLEYEGYVKVEKAELQFERFNGTMSPVISRFRHFRGDAVAVMIYEPLHRQVLLINQFRYPVFARSGEGWFWECVAGMTEENERPEDVARREVQEETGLRLKRCEYLTEYFFAPGGSSDKVILFLGEVDNPQAPLGTHGLLHEGEEIQAHWVALEEALSWMDSGKLCDAKAMIGLMLLERRLRLGNEKSPSG
ncbi:MAG: NUDIX domain-containing protein [Terriglobia bacterium]